MMPTLGHLGFVSAKEKSRFNFSWWLAPLIGTVLLFLGEVLGFFMSEGLGAIFPLDSEILDLMSFAAIILAVLLWAKCVEKAPLDGLGLTKQGAVTSFLKGWFWGGAMLCSCVVLMLWTGSARLTGTDFSQETLGRFLLLLLAWSIQGTAEEVLCRGWLFTSLATRYSKWIAILISAVFFTAMHLGNDGIEFIPLLDLFCFGVLGCLVMMKTKNLWVISGLHAAWNCFQGNVFAFPVSGTNVGSAFIQVSPQGPDWLSGGAFGVEGSVISVLVQTVLIVIISYQLFGPKATESL